MAIIKAQGLQLAIGSFGTGTAINMTAITNAAEAVATLAASHGVVVNDIIVPTSGWKRLDQRVVRVKTVATNDVTLEGINTTSTTEYPTGSGIGTVKKVTSWTTITQLKRDVTTGGGGFETSDATTLDDVRTQNVPVIAVGTTATFNVFWDPTLSWFSAVRSAALAGTLFPFRETLGNGSKIYGNAYWGFNEEPQIVDGLLTAQITLNSSPDTTTYTS